MLAKGLCSPVHVNGFPHFYCIAQGEYSKCNEAFQNNQLQQHKRKSLFTVSIIYKSYFATNAQL